MKIIAMKIDRNRTTVSRLLHGRLAVSVKTLELIAELLRCPPDILDARNIDDAKFEKIVIALLQQHSHPRIVSIGSCALMAKACVANAIRQAA